MLRNEVEFSLPSKETLTEHEVLVFINESFFAEKPLNSVSLSRNVIAYIASCNDAALLARMAQHAQSDVRCLAATNKHLPEDIVWKLASDADFRVRMRLAQNHALPVFVLEALAEDEDDRVSQRASETLESPNSEGLVKRVMAWMRGAHAVREAG